MKPKKISEYFFGYVAMLVAACIFLVFSYYALFNESIDFSNRPLGVFAIAGWQKNMLGICSLYIAAYFAIFAWPNECGF